MHYINVSVPKITQEKIEIFIEFVRFDAALTEFMYNLLQFVFTTLEYALNIICAETHCMHIILNITR